jgi:hypothetical protein
MLAAGNYIGLLDRQREARLAAGEGNGSTTAGFLNSKIESSVREDAVSLLDEVDGGNTTLEKAYSRLRKLYSPNEVRDEALKQLMGIATTQTSKSPIATYGNKPTPYQTIMSGKIPVKDKITNSLYNSLFKIN